MDRIPLTPEETFLWDCAQAWRSPAGLAAAEELDWPKVATTSAANRMQVLLNQALAASGLLRRLPEDTRQSLAADADRLAGAAAAQSRFLSAFLHRAAESGIETVVHKGLSLSINLYGDPAMRPGGDIDLLVRRSSVAGALQTLQELEVGSYWPNLLDDRYYARHHLHQQRSTPDLRIWFEVHWALDHPYTLQTIDYEALMDRTSPGELLGEPVRDLSLPDLLISLAVHLVKHAIYLPAALDRPDLARVILADGMLMYYLDVAEVVKRHAGGIDWDRCEALARQSGTVEILGSVLRVCREFLGAPVPEQTLAALPVQGPGRLNRLALNKMADREVENYLGRERSRFWDFLVITNGAFILRPIRILDLSAYFFPPTDFLIRKYGSASTRNAVKHLLRALAQYSRLSVDTVFFTWERYRRLRALQQSASLFNRLEVDP
jgi:hypothetical protein